MSEPRDPLAGLYQELILEHAKRREGEGRIEPFDVERFLRNPTCGDEIRLRIRVRDGAVDALGWEGQGCSISQASAYLYTTEDEVDRFLDALSGVRAYFGAGR